MKNKTLSSALCLFLLCSAQAKSQDLMLCNNDDIHYTGHRLEISVSYDETTVTLKSEETLENVYVVIKDFDGNVIYAGWTTIDRQSDTIVMPVEEGTEKCTIEVYVDEKCLTGIFE